MESEVATLPRVCSFIRYRAIMSKVSIILGQLESLDVAEKAKDHADLRAPTVHGSVHQMPTAGSKWVETNGNRSDKCVWHLIWNVAAGANLR